MIEQRVNKELNKEQVELKLGALSIFDNAVLICSGIVIVAVFFGLLSLLRPDNPQVSKFLLAIPAYKLLIATVTGLRAQFYKHQCLETHKIVILDNAILLNIFTVTLIIGAIQQICAILTGFQSAGSYAYYIIILVAVASLFLLRSDYVLKTSACMVLLCSIDFVLFIWAKQYCHVDYAIKQDITVLVNSAIAAIIAVALSCYAANLFHKFFTLYCLREAKLRHYKAIAETDALTKISNRRAFDLDIELLSTAHIKTVAVAMFDIDDFKKFNDEYGHDIGDYVLEQVGRLISVFNDHNGIEAYRYGGEELVVVFSYISPTYNTEEQIELFRHAVSNVKIPNVKRNITISAGLAYSNVGTILKGDLRKEALMNLVKEADKNLYEAKHTGKNKLCTSHVKLTENTSHGGKE